METVQDHIPTNKELVGYVKVRAALVTVTGGAQDAERRHIAD